LGPTLEALLEVADTAWKNQAWSDALGAYKQALMIAPPSDRALFASIYTRVGDVKRHQGKPREAEANLEKALEIDPTYREVHEALVALAEEATDFRRVVAHRTRMRTVLADPTQLIQIANVLHDKLDDARGAALALEEARLALPEDRDVSDRLCRLYEAEGNWTRLFELLGELGSAARDRRERAELRFRQADVALGRLRDEARGIACLRSCLDEEPANDQALSALVAVCSRRQEWALLDDVYAKMIDRFATSGDADRAWRTCQRLGLLRRDAMGDVEGAIEAFAGAVQCRPSDVEARAARADLLMTKGDGDGALSELAEMAKREPLRVATYRKLYELHARAGRVDRAWLAATALEELGAADLNHELVIEQYRLPPTEVARPRAAFEERHWRDSIRADRMDEGVAAILRAVARAAATLRVESLRREKRLVSLDPERKQSATGTVSIVRTFVWASQVLHVPLPELYVYDEVPGGLAAVPGDARATAIGPDVLTGTSLQELVFLVSRHLTYYRPEHYVLVFYPTLAELSQLFLSAVEVGLPDMPVSSRGGADGKRLVAGLRKALTDIERKELEMAAARFEERGGRVDLSAWICGVELTATRAGFVLCGDLSVAMRVLRREDRSIAELALDDKRADLLAFSASERLASLRDELSLARRPDEP
jgi:tetratricopeptide (TPR) repeat protein